MRVIGRRKCFNSKLVRLKHKKQLEKLKGWQLVSIPNWFD